MIIDATFEEQAEMQASFGEITKVSGGYIDVDDHMSTTSENPVQNKVVTHEINTLSESHNRLAEQVQNINTSVSKVTDDFIAHQQQCETRVDNLDKFDEEFAKKVFELENNKQDKLTFDDYPNETSENPVTSKGIDKALHDLADIQNMYIVDSINAFKENYADKTYVTKGEIETALDGIIAIQNSLIGGGA